MSITSLIIAVISVSAICISTLWIFQIKKQRAIERARKKIIFTSQISQIHEIVESLAHFLDDNLLAFLAKSISENIEQMDKHNIEPDKRSQNTQEQAKLWMSAPRKIRKQFQNKKPEKKQARLLQMKSITQFIRQAISRRSISRKEALSLVDSTKIGKIKLTCYYHQQDADKAIQNNNTAVAIQALKKINDLQVTLDKSNTLLKEQQETIKNTRSSGTKRLENEFDKQEEIDHDWQKKQLYDP